MNLIEEKIIRLIAAYGTISQLELQLQTELSHRELEDYLQSLKNAHLIQINSNGDVLQISLSNGSKNTNIRPCECNETYPIPKSMLKDIIPQNLPNASVFIEQFEYFYPQFFKIACIITRRFKGTSSTIAGDKIYELTRLLIEAWTRIAIHDLQRIDVSSHDCPGCSIPYFDESVPLSDPDTEEKDVSANYPTTQSLQQSPPTTSQIKSAPKPKPIFILNPKVPLTAEVHRFIQMSSKVKYSEILTIFNKFQIKEAEIEKSLHDLIYEGKIYQPTSGYYEDLENA
ncbi:MAG: hypothetical protein ACTSRC_09395 [Candidatus Helarchaeota archaeon]